MASTGGQLSLMVLIATPSHCDTSLTCCWLKLDLHCFSYGPLQPPAAKGLMRSWDVCWFISKQWQGYASWLWVFSSPQRCSKSRSSQSRAPMCLGFRWRFYTWGDSGFWYICAVLFLASSDKGHQAPRTRRKLKQTPAMGFLQGKRTSVSTTVPIHGQKELG